MSEQKNMGFSTFKLPNYEKLKASLEMGMEIEFFLYGIRYVISWESDGRPAVAECPDDYGKIFKDIDDLLNNCKIKGKFLKDIWQDIDIMTM